MLAARESGAREVFVTARYPHQRALAESLGVTRVFGTIDEMVEGIGPESMDVVIETVGGKSDALTEAVSVVARGGTIAMLGVFDGSPRIPRIAVRRSRTDAGRIVLLRARLEDRRFRVRDRRLLSKYRYLLPELVTHKFKLDEVSRAFEAANDKRSGSIKVQIEP